MSGGSVRVSFAGTFSEAVEWCRNNPGIFAPKGLARAGDDDGLPMLSIPYRNTDEFLAAQRRFEELGWDREFQSVNPHGRGFHGTN